MTDYSSHSAASEQAPASTAGSSSGVSFDKTKPSALTIILNAIRGGLIGLAELRGLEIGLKYAKKGL